MPSQNTFRSSHHDSAQVRLATQTLALSPGLLFFRAEIILFCDSPIRNKKHFGLGYVVRVKDHLFQRREKMCMPDRLFNTNEKFSPGAYKKMFCQGVIAICGYPDGPKRLEGCVEGQRVFAYVNKKGILAVGYIVDPEPVPCPTVFTKNEFHVKVDWEIIVAKHKGVKYTEVKAQHGYNLPLGFCIRNMRCSSEVTDWIADELQRRRAE